MLSPLWNNLINKRKWILLGQQVFLLSKIWIINFSILTCKNCSKSFVGVVDIWIDQVDYINFSVGTLRFRWVDFICRSSFLGSAAVNWLLFRKILSVNWGNLLKLEAVTTWYLILLTWAFLGILRWMVSRLNIWSWKLVWWALSWTSH